MKTYLVYWEQPNGCGDNHLMNSYDTAGNTVDQIGQEVFSTPDEKIARRVYDAELAYANSVIPKLSSFPWAADLQENDAAWKNVWNLVLESLDMGEDGETENYETLLSSDNFYKE